MRGRDSLSARWRIDSRVRSTESIPSSPRRREGFKSLTAPRVNIGRYFVEMVKRGERLTQ